MRPQMPTEIKTGGILWLIWKLAEPINDDAFKKKLVAALVAILLITVLLPVVSFLIWHAL